MLISSFIVSQERYNLEFPFFFIQDISELELKDLQNERCPRISANDVIDITTERPDEIAVIDLRSHLEFNRAHLKGSINIPFASISLSDVRLDVLNVPDLKANLTNRVVVVASNSHENAILVSLKIRNLSSVEWNKPMTAVLLSVCSFSAGLWHEKCVHPS